MALMRWNPWAEMASLRNEIDNMLEGSFALPFAGFWRPGTMALDLYEEGDRFELTASLPGVKPEDVEVTVRGNILTIKAESESTTERKEANYLLREQQNGSFHRVVQLPVDVDPEKCSLRFENGMLYLTLPKVEVTRAHCIPVEGVPTTKMGQPLPTAKVEQPVPTTKLEQPAPIEEPAAQQNGQRQPQEGELAGTLS